MGDELSYPLEEYQVEALSNETFRRIRLLLSRGYRLVEHDPISMDNDTMYFEHPGSAPAVFLFSTGTLGSAEAELKPRRLYKDRIFKNNT